LGWDAAGSRTPSPGFPLSRAGFGIKSKEGIFRCKVKIYSALCRERAHAFSLAEPFEFRIEFGVLAWKLALLEPY